MEILYGYTLNIEKILNILYKKRKDGIINQFISFYMDYNNNNLYILTDRGRCTRPLLKINNNKILIKIQKI